MSDVALTTVQYGHTGQPSRHLSGSIAKYIYPALVRAGSLGAGRPTIDTCVMPAQKLLVVAPENGERYPSMRTKWAHELAEPGYRPQTDMCLEFITIFSEEVNAVFANGILFVVGTEEKAEHFGLSAFSVESDSPFSHGSDPAAFA